MQDFYDKLIAAINKINEIDVIAGIKVYSGATAPTNFMLCDGSAISRTTYSVLFGIIGTTYGVGNGTTTFNIPDLRARFLVGFHSGDSDYDSLGEIGGAKNTALSKANIPPHTHTYSAANGTPDLGNSGVGVVVYANQSQNTGDGSADGVGAGGTAGAGAPFDKRPPYIAMNYIIKVI